MNKAMALTTAVCMVSLGAMGQEAPAAGGFKTSLNLGATLNDGNSETMNANGSLVTEGEKEGLGSVRVGAEANYGESKVDGETDTTVENAKAFANAKKTLSERTYASLDGSVLYDDVAAIDYRAVLSPALGAYLLKGADLSLSIDAGPACIWEKVGGVSDDYLALRFAERFDYTISETSKFWQSLEFLPTADDFDDYLLNAEVGVEAAMNSHMKLRLVVQNKYDSTPAAELEKNDLTLIAGIGLTL
jgi:putative salt-induced outer membrane protein YdiY